MKSMKNIAKIIAAGSVLIALTACSHVAKYTTYDFVAFAATSYTVNESTTTLVIPVCAYPEVGESNTTVSFDVKNGSAVAGTDFTFSPANGVLNFSGDKAQSITINIMGHPGEFTGDLKFTIELKDASNNYEMNSYSTASVTIKDEDHPLSSILGDYTMKAVGNVDGGYNYFTWDISLSPYEGNVTRVWIDFPAPFFSPSYYGSYAPDANVYAVVSDDLQTISIPCPQAIGSTAEAAFGVPENFILLKYDGDDLDAPFITDPSEIVFTRQEDGSYRTFDSYGFSTESYISDGWFWYYMNVFGNFNPNYPAAFTKK